MTGQMPPVPVRLPVDSRGRWAGTRLRREPRFSRRDADGHPAGPGLPTQRLHPSPSSGSRPVAGRTARWQGDEEQDWSPTPCAEGRVLQGFPGTPACDRALSSDACSRLSLPRAMSFMMEIWLNYYGDDFHQFPEFPSLIKLLELLRQHMPGTDAHLRALRHLRQFRRLHAAEREAGGEEDWGWPSWGCGGPQIQPPCCWTRSRGWAHTPPHGLQPGDTSQGSCPHTRGVVGRVALIWEGRGQSVLVVILCLLGSTASARGKHPEPTLECTPAPTVGPAAPWGLAAGAEGLACDEPPAGEAKPLQIVVTAALQESPAPLGALDEEQAPPPALEVMDVPEQPPNSMEQPAIGPKQPCEPPREPAPAPTVGPAEASG